MNDFENRLGEALSSEGKFDAGKGEEQRKEIVQMYDKWLRTATIITWAGVAIGVMLEIIGVIGVVLGVLGFWATKLVILFAVVALSGGAVAPPGQALVLGVQH